MDEITDNVGGLSLSAKEWRPGEGFAATPGASSAPSGAATVAAAEGQVTAGSAESKGSGESCNNVSGQSSWETYLSMIIVKNLYFPSLSCHSNSNP